MQEMSSSWPCASGKQRSFAFDDNLTSSLPNVRHYLLSSTLLYYTLLLPLPFIDTRRKIKVNIKSVTTPYHIIGYL